MDFRKYSSITNTYNNKFIEKIRFSLNANEKFLCFEKLHGANFQIRLFEKEGQLEMEFGKRNSLLTIDMNFMEFQKYLLTPEIKGYAKNVWELVKSQDVNMVTIFGEYFGGRYPHIDLDPDSNKPIQKEIWYSQKRLFCPFDLLINDQYMNIKEALEIFKKAGFFCLDPIKEGTLDELLNFDVETFMTTVPPLFNLPEIKNNYAEGIIIRPVKESRTLRNDRIILKKKRNKFSEKKTIKNNVIKSKVPLSQKVMDTINELESYVTKARLDNLISKEGNIPNNKKIMKFAGLYAQDIFNEYEENTGKKLNMLEPADRKIISGTINKFSCDLIKENLDSVMEE